MITIHRYIYGLGGVGREIADVLSMTGEKLSGFVVDSEYINSSPHEVMNVPVISFEDYAGKCKTESNIITVSLGEPVHRKMLSQKLRTLNLQEGTINLGEYLATDSNIGSGTILHLGSVVSSNCSIGRSCLINKKAIIGHDNAVGDYCVICPCVVTGGHVSIGDNCFIGLGACIRDRVRIGNNVIIGMGSVVIHDVEDDVIVYGNPAKVIRRNDTHKVFK